MAGKTHWLLLAIAALVVAVAGPVCAGETAPGPSIDLDTVRATGKVEPVGGMSSAGQPDAAALEVFAASGYAAVIDLRGADEARGIDEAEVVEGLGMDYIALPVASGADVSYANARRLGELLDRYEEPVLVHCASGNRVGALVALNARLQGADADAALEAGRDAGLTSLEETVRQRLAEAPAGE